jgi:hypothetical protein
MAQILALYGNDSDLTVALDNLRQAHGDAVEVDVVDRLPRETGNIKPVGVMPPNETVDAVGAVALPASAKALLDANDETADYFRRALKSGQTLVIVETDHDYVEPVRRTLTEHGGKVTRS